MRTAIMVVLLSAASTGALAKDASVQQQAWVACLRETGSKFATQDATPDNVADAAFGSCTTEEQRFSAQMQKTPTLERMFTGPRTGGRDYREQFARDFAGLKAQYRSELIAATMNQRSGKAFSSAVSAEKPR